MTVSHRHVPVAMLVLACLFWGMGFSWAKNVGEAINAAAGRPIDGPLGPLVGLTGRFLVAGLLWFALVPAVRRNWTWRTVRRGTVIGFMLSLALILQHVGLGLSDEAVIAFLTNLTVVFVPLWVLLATRRWPRPAVLTAVPIALAGMALLSGLRTNWTASTGVSAGAWWGVACAAAFAAEILLLDRLGRDESPERITLLLFVTAFVLCAVTAVALPGFGRIHWPAVGRIALGWDFVLLTGLTTVAAFSIMTRCQPRVDPTRAAVIYLAEPLFAAVFAWVHNARSMSADALAGAGLILLANIVAEVRGRRVRSEP